MAQGGGAHRAPNHHHQLARELARKYSGITGYVNPEMDRLVERIEVELDRDARQALWRRLQHIYAEDLPVIPLYFRAEPYIFPKWLKGVVPTGHQVTTTNWIENWRVEP